MLESRNEKIFLDKEPNELDKFVLLFIRILKEMRIRYVIVSGYPAILFGRSRLTEDVDFIIEKINLDKLKNLIDKCDESGLWIINPESPENLMELLAESNIRVAKEGEGIPNIELKFAKDEIESYALENSTEVVFDGSGLRISPMELQIAYKLYLGSEKDIEDAKYLYNVCRKIIDSEKLAKFLNLLKIKESTRRLALGDNCGH